MLVFPGILNVNFHIVAFVHLLQDIFVDVHRYLGLVSYLVIKGHDSLGGPIEILAKLGEVVLVEVLDGYWPVDLVHGGVLHDFHDPHLLGQLNQLILVGRIRELICRNCEEKLILEVLDGEHLDVDGVDGGGDDGLPPDNDAWVDGSIAHVFLSEFSLIESHSLRITFYFRREH